MNEMAVMAATTATAEISESLGAQAVVEAMGATAITVTIATEIAATVTAIATDPHAGVSQTSTPIIWTKRTSHQSQGSSTYSTTTRSFAPLATCRARTTCTSHSV
jgi:hypothetical protein